jgi:hypothetical protein
MAHLPPFESLFPFSDDVSGMTMALNEICDGCDVVEVPLGFIGVRGLTDFTADEMPPREGTH